MKRQTPLDVHRIVEERELVHGARVLALEQPEHLPVLLRRRRERGFGEDEDLALDAGLKLVEALDDRPGVAQHLDVLEWVSEAQALFVGRGQLLDHGGRLTLERGQLLAALPDEAFEPDLRRCRAVLHGVARPARGQALADEGREDIVDALPRQLGEARHLHGSGGVAAQEREIRPGFVRGQAERTEAIEEQRFVH